MTDSFVDLDTTRARCFVEVVERGTVAAAARALGYTPSAVSQQIAKLERSVEVPLFDRMSGRLRPTPAGAALLPHLYAVLDSLESGRRSAQAAAAGHQAAVTVAAFPSALLNLVAPAAGRPGSVLGLVTEAEDPHGLRELSLGHVDVALVQEHSHQRYERDPRLVYHRLLRDPLDLVVPREDVPLPRTFAEAGDLAWVVSPQGSPCRASTQEAWRKAGIAPRVTAVAGELASIVALIACGVGVGLLPRLGLPADLERVRVVPGVSPVVRTVYAVTRRTHSKGGVAEAVQSLRAVAKDVAGREILRWDNLRG